MRRTIFFIILILIVLVLLYFLIFRIIDWQKILIGIAAIFPFGQALQKKLAEIDKEFAKRRLEESEFQSKMTERRGYLEQDIVRIEKSIELLEKKYDLLEKQRSTISETIEKMPREKKIELFREVYGE